MILEGGNIEIDNDDSAVDVSEASLSIAQLIRFNSLRRRRSSAANTKGTHENRKRHDHFITVLCYTLILERTV